jgi:hypothetical protein
MVRRRRVIADDAVAEGEVVHHRADVERPPWSPAQLIAVLLGIVFLVVGGISLARTGVHTNNMNAHFANTPLWDHTAWLALGELFFGLLLLGAGVVPGGARGLMTFLGMIALAFGIAVLVAPTSLGTYTAADSGTGWAYIVVGAILLVAASVSPIFFTGDRRAYGRRREILT